MRSYLRSAVAILLRRKPLIAIVVGVAVVAFISVVITFRGSQSSEQLQRWRLETGGTLELLVAFLEWHHRTYGEYPRNSSDSRAIESNYGFPIAKIMADEQIRFSLRILSLYEEGPQGEVSVNRLDGIAYYSNGDWYVSGERAIRALLLEAERNRVGGDLDPHDIGRAISQNGVFDPTNGLNSAGFMFVGSRGIQFPLGQTISDERLEYLREWE